MVYFKEEKELINNNNWTRKKNVKIFLKNNTTSEICEKWILYCDNNYVYIRSEKLHTHLGELLYAREHKAGLSKKKKSCVYINIDGLKMCSDYDDESVFRPKKEYIDMHDKMNIKIYGITDLIKIIKKINHQLKK